MKLWGKTKRRNRLARFGTLEDGNMEQPFKPIKSVGRGDNMKPLWLFDKYHPIFKAKIAHHSGSLVVGLFHPQFDSILDKSTSEVEQLEERIPHPQVRFSLSPVSVWNIISQSAGTGTTRSLLFCRISLHSAY